MESDNQLHFVREVLTKMPRAEWASVAIKADITLRTLYNVYDPARKPGYDTVYRVYSVLKSQAAEKAIEDGLRI